MGVRKTGEVFAEIALPERERRSAADCGVHPALLDAAQHAAFFLSFGDHDGDPGAARLPFAWTGVRLHAAGAAVLRARLTPLAQGGLAVLVADATGAAVCSIDSLTLRAATPASLTGAATHGLDALFRLAWTAVDRPPAAARRRWAVLGVGGHRALRALIEDLESGAEPVDALFVACEGGTSQQVRSAAQRMLALLPGPPP